MNQNFTKHKKPIKFNFLFLFLATGAILLLSQILLAQDDSKNTINNLPNAKLIESYSAFKSDEASMIIDLLRNEVSKNSNSRGFIVVYCGKVCQYGEIEAHLRGIKLALQFKGADENRFTVISGGFREKTTTEFWLIPENACLPMPNSSADFKEIKFKGKYKKKIVDYECCF